MGPRLSMAAIAAGYVNAVGGAARVVRKREMFPFLYGAGSVPLSRGLVVRDQIRRMDGVSSWLQERGYTFDPKIRIFWHKAFQMWVVENPAPFPICANDRHYWRRYDHAVALCKEMNKE